MKVAFVVTHLLGSGHLSRVLTLARAFSKEGHDSFVISGGMPVPHLDHDGIELIQLPPVRSNGVDFSTLLDATGAQVSRAYLTSRQDSAIAALRRIQPDALITELFPFGRKSLADEFTVILGAAHALPRRPVILSSIRDILAPPRKPGKAERAEASVVANYDAVLVHSDPDVIPLETSWPVTDTLFRKLVYTGFVAPPFPRASKTAHVPQGEIIASAGGGSVGQHLFDAALEAAGRSNHGWRLLIGGGDAANRAAAMQLRAPANARVEPARPDFRQLLQQAACSVSLCGYNTALDVLQAGCPAIFIPFDEGVEVEQGLRADQLAHRAWIDVLRANALTADALLHTIASVMDAPRSLQQEALQTDGAARTVEIVSRLVRQRASA
ncbi:MAG: glycosyltransferase [Pseudomonadota bacterium]